MYSLFRLLFSAGYWRTLFSSDFWVRTARSVRRVHKDRRARKQLRSALIFLIAPVLCIVYAFWLLAMVFGAGVFGIGIVALVAVIVTIVEVNRRRKASEKKRAELAANPELRPPPPPPSPELRRTFAELALLHAVYADRSGSEQFLHTKILPEGIEIITRRVQLDLLRDRGLYNRIEDSVRNLLLRADGHWTAADCHEGSLALEPLRVLRWCLRLDHYLPSIGEAPRLDYKLSSQTVKDPDSLFRGSDFVSYDTLNIAFRAAANFMHRCFAEAVVRGLMQPADEEDAARARRIVDDHSGNEHKDLVLGDTIVSKATDGDILHARLLAARRYHLLSWIARVQYGDFEVPDVLRIFFKDPPSPTSPEDSDL
ncbi:hypothetical protein SAMN05421819_2122 [Bryocella elongata]|uniref:Uncharacterized protein n=1 Tax=Bryocella elongata TaxID=863522 RepID=A0A1H5Y5G2_9BACT|nr:hypothetical protein [Bryocella elongata]SEG18937.1 hypothetical protein SAMN05421819_2122 [Bryocella elongata]